MKLFFITAFPCLFHVPVKKVHDTKGVIGKTENELLVILKNSLCVNVIAFERAI